MTKYEKKTIQVKRRILNKYIVKSMKEMNEDYNDDDIIKSMIFSYRHNLKTDQFFPYALNLVDLLKQYKPEAFL